MPVLGFVSATVAMVGAGVGIEAIVDAGAGAGIVGCLPLVNTEQSS